MRKIILNYTPFTAQSNGYLVEDDNTFTPITFSSELNALALELMQTAYQKQAFEINIDNAIIGDAVERILQKAEGETYDRHQIRIRVVR